MKQPAMTEQQRRVTERNEGALRLYKDLVVGKEKNYLSLLFFELITFALKNMPTAIGLVLRALCYKFFLGQLGTKSLIGSAVTVRQPAKIKIGNKVVIDDFVTLDVRGERASITIGDNVVIGRFTTITAKDAEIVIQDGCNIGSYCRIATQSGIRLAESVLVAAYCYIGPGNHRRDDEEKPLIESSMEIKSGVSIGAYSWIGAKSTVLDGAIIGSEAIVGAHSLVKSAVPDKGVVAGVPAKPLDRRADKLE